MPNKTEFIYSPDIPIKHGWFSLRGGVSQFQGRSGQLNGKAGKWDKPENVERNWQLASQSLGVTAPVKRAAHGFSDKIAIVDESSPEVTHGVDAIINFDGSVAIGQQTGDCGNVLLFCQRPQVVAFVHASYKTLIRRVDIITKTIQVLADHGVAPTNIHAALGPMICAGCYEFKEHLALKLFDQKYITQRPADGKVGLDITQIIVDQLADSGAVQDDPPSVCTYEDNDWASARRDGQQSPRYISLASLERIK